MRFLSAVLFVALTGSVALADDAKPADAQPEATVKAPKQRVPLRVVRMLPETRQVLLFDKTKGTHVVAEVGQDVDGYRVDDIDDDEVTLIAPSGSEVILTAPWHRKADKKTDAKKADPAPQDPYADATSAAPAGPTDPYGDTADGSSPTSAAAATPSTSAPVVAGDNGDRVVSASGAASTASGAPSDPYGDPAVNAFFDAVNSSSPPATKPAPPTSKTTKPAKASVTSSADGAALGAALTGSPAPASTPSATSSASTSPTPSTTPTASPSPTASAPSPGPTTATIKRADVDAALGDFAGTASSFQAAFTPQGLRFDAVADGSLLAKVGLQKGDVLTTVDGQPLRSLDDAANLYARLPTAHGSTLQVQRAGKPITLRIAIQ